jgi:hypothetical protein
MKYDRTNDDSIDVLVHAFYEKVRLDAQLAPMFNEAIGKDWDAHISTMRFLEHRNARFHKVSGRHTCCASALGRPTPRAVRAVAGTL